MKISDNCIKLVAKWEGFYTKAYLCPANVWTIGYGTTKWPDGRAVKKGDTITQAEAWELLKIQVQQHANTIPTYVKVQLNQNQYDALASLQYNCGAHILKTSNTLRNALNAKDWNKAADALLTHNKARVDGVLQELRGLTNRRKEERTLFLTKWEGLSVTEAEKLLKIIDEQNKRIEVLEQYINNTSDTPATWADKAVKKAIKGSITDGKRLLAPTTRQEVLVLLDRCGVLPEEEK